MSARAVEFVETWVSEKIDAMKLPALAAAQAKALAAQCAKDAQASGIPQSEIDGAFDDLAAFIAGQIQEARERGADRSREKHPGILIEDDDSRIIDEEEDEAAKKGS